MSYNKRLSFEFFPPKTEQGMVKLTETRDALGQLRPAFFSVTYGAGGSTRDTTRSAVMDIHCGGYEVAPHLSFGGDGEATVLSLLEDYRQRGIRRIVALRGDLPSGMGMARPVYASELVRFIRQHTGEHFQIEVAAYPEVHPEANSYDEDVNYLKQKLDAGANSALTQYFYDADAYSWFLEKCHRTGIEVPIYPGIMPITNYQNLARFSARCGASIPRWVAKQLESYGEQQNDVIDFGIDLVSRLCEKLLAAGAPGLHFYTMNQAEPTLSICSNIGIRPEAT
jgi:methylenetetrahydrofolate reductase (NADPH)